MNSMQTNELEPEVEHLRRDDESGCPSKARAAFYFRTATEHQVMVPGCYLIRLRQHYSAQGRFRAVRN
jgi:hypothetical protein